MVFVEFGEFGGEFGAEGFDCGLVSCFMDDVIEDLVRRYSI